MKPTCKKCGSIAIIRDDYGVGDDREEAIRCLTCGWRIAKPRPEAPALTAEQKNADSRPVRDMVPCARRGCSGRVRKSTPLRLCRNCNIKLKNWQYGNRTTPPPYIQLADGTWVVNSERARRSAA